MEECKMHKDSMNFSTSGHMTHNQASTQGSLTKSLKCSHCKLVFRSKSYLFEHLNMVHGLDVNAESLLRNPGTNKASADSSAGSYFECQNCDFKAPGQDVLNEHAERCQKKSENQSKIDAVDTAENSDAKSHSTNQQEDAAEAAEITSVLPVMSTSQTTCTVTSSKDVKTYKRPSQTITKHFAASSGSNLRLAEVAALSNSAKGTLILQQSPSGSNPNSSGVFKVTAKRTIDMSGNDSTLCLLEDGFLCTDLRQPKSQEQIKETHSQPVANRTKKDWTKCPPAKKTKSDRNELKLKEGESAEKLLTSREFAFECSDDEDEEEEKKGHLVNGDIPSPKSYFCKHCDFSGANIKQVSTHYQNVHPYIRFNTLYIEEPGNQSVTFRCLQCPVEFLGVRDLKKHYVENHAEAPDVFTMQAHELCLRFKCFLCPFTTDALQALKKHYKENHPTHQLDNSLMSCKYSVARNPEGPPQFEEASIPGISRRISPESAHPPCMEVNNPPPLQPPTPNEGDVTLYHCNNCNFSHRSVVVMHVHYQKFHPDEQITIDKLKQAVCVTSHTSSHVMHDTSPDPLMEKSTPLKSVSDFSEKAGNEPEPSPPSEISPSLIDTKLTPETDSEPKKAESSLDRSKRKKFPTKRKLEMDTLSCSPQNQLFHCKFCSYSSINIKSLVGHHNVKHPTETLMNTGDIVQYSAEVERGESEAEASSRAAASDLKASERVDVCGENELLHEDAEAADASGTRFNAYACAENLFYCQMCNFANVSVKGILNHQHHAHKSILPNSKPVLEHTTEIRDEIKKSKPQGTELPFATRLPLPLMSQADENAFFCHFCNYRRGSVKQLLQHYSRKHQGFLVTSDHIYQYTSMVLERTETSRPKTTADQDAGHAFLWEKEKTFKISKKLGKVSALPSARASQTQRVLLCQRCPYSTQYLYLLKRHICKMHTTKCSLEDVLRECFKQGALQAGFHCDMCVFSHQTAVVVHKHYKTKHPGRKLSLDYVATRLHIGPETSTPVKRRPLVKPTDGGGGGGGGGGGDASDGSSSFQRSGQSEAKVYSCKACSFKGSSMSSIGQHYRAVHPWSVKEDGSVLDVIDSKRWSANRQLDEHDETPPSFETYQVPLEFDSSANSSSAGLECPHCPATFSSQRGLNTHCGMKHRDCVTEYSDEQQEERAETQSRAHIFKCPYCSYVNNSHHGVVTHCQMKHPDLESRAESSYLDEAYSDNVNNCTRSKSGVWRLCGYVCKSCPTVCPTMEKLNKHREKDHCETVPNEPKSPLNASVFTLKKSYKSHSSQGSVLKASFMGSKLYGEHRCQHCLYSCRTKLALSRHVHLRHKGASISKARECYKCALCSSSCRNKKQLGNHYITKHGKESFIKYFASLFKRVHTNPAPSPLRRTPEDTSEASHSGTTAEENKKLVFRCPECPYVNASYHGTLTHCQMRHPDLEVRADALQTDVILLSNMVRCKMGKGSNESGYMCRECPQIHMSLKKLKIHCKNYHDKTERIPSETETKMQTDYSPQYSVLEAFALKSNTSPGDAAETDPSHQLGTPEPGQDYQYECSICTYKGSCRKYLYCHYKNTHKFDALTTLRALEKYNKYRKRKRSSFWPEAKSEESAHVKCQVCPDLNFDTPQLLIAHYSTSHISDILDFTVLSHASKRTTGLYICALCNKQMNGTKKLRYHLDNHREKELAKAAKTKASPVVTTTPEAESTELYQQDELPMLENVEDLNQWNVTPVETFTLPPSPLSSPPKSAELEQPEVESREDKRTCKQCGRTFMSLKGLRSHERSHAALAAIKNLDKLSSVASKHNIDKYMSYKPGTQRPFLCSFCTFRTTVMGLWRCHFMKNHLNVIEDPAEANNTDRSVQTANRQLFHSSEDLNSSSELDNKSEIAENSLYLEPPDVQRQLDHYNLMARTGAQSKASVKETKLPDNGLLHCDICSFNTGHMSSIRRHYLNRHGKKLLRCKKCNFFTSLRKTLEMHMETGHFTCQSEATHQKVLRCPFCLYQTKNKNNMIDHIVLHREERVVPIEVRRSKLSRYLRGIVFRCHKCTFTCGSAENLHSHMMRHEDIKPYKCRLCYFDCPQLSDLEAHLTDKHQVLRNHELVGQVSLDEMEARAGSSMPVESLLPGLERQNSDREDVKTEEFFPDRTQAKNPEGSNIKEKSIMQIGATHQWRDYTGNKESRENTKLNAAVQGERGQDVARERGRENPSGQDVGEGNDSDIRYEDCNRQEKEGSTKEDESQLKLSDGGGSSSAFTIPKNEAAEGNSTMCIKVAENMQAHKLHIKTLKHRTLNIVARIEEDLIRHTTLLNDNGSFCKTHKMGDQEGTVKVERNIEPEVADNVLNKILLLDKQGRHTLAPTPKNPVNAAAISLLPKKNHWQANNNKAKECFSIEKHLLSLKPNCGQPKISHKELLAVSFANCKEERVQLPQSGEEVRDPYGEMPVLENEYLKEEMQPLGFWKEEDQNDRLKQKQDKNVEMVAEGDEDKSPVGIKKAGDPRVLGGALTATDRATEVLRPAAAEKKLFTCEYCGRSLTNSSDLERHIKRHGL